MGRVLKCLAEQDDACGSNLVHTKVDFGKVLSAAHQSFRASNSAADVAQSQSSCARRLRNTRCDCAYTFISKVVIREVEDPVRRLFDFHRVVLLHYVSFGWEELMRNRARSFRGNIIVT
jgi:hypothetical protein